MECQIQSAIDHSTTRVPSQPTMDFPQIRLLKFYLLANTSTVALTSDAGLFNALY